MDNVSCPNFVSFEMMWETKERKKERKKERMEPLNHKIGTCVWSRQMLLFSCFLQSRPISLHWRIPLTRTNSERRVRAAAAIAAFLHRINNNKAHSLSHTHTHSLERSFVSLASGSTSNFDYYYLATLNRYSSLTRSFVRSFVRTSIKASDI